MTLAARVREGGERGGEERGGRGGEGREGGREGGRERGEGSVFAKIDYISRPSGEVTEHTYMGTVSSVKLNGYYAAALLEGRIKLHTVSPLTTFHIL